MTARKLISITLILLTLILSVSMAPQASPGARAEQPKQSPSGSAVPYSGQLSDDTGQPAPAGSYDFKFSLYSDETGGELLWTEIQTGISVKDGLFTALLGSVSSLPEAFWQKGVGWLEVEMRAPGEADFTPLSPRQKLIPTSSSVPSAPTALSCAHTHFGENWTGANTNYGLRVGTSGNNSTAIEGVASTGTDSWGISGYSAPGQGVHGQSDTGTGIYGSSASGKGVYGSSSSNIGVYGISTTHIGVYATGSGSGHDHAALTSVSTQTGCGIAAYFRSSGTCPAFEIDQNSTGTVVDLQNHGDANGAGGGNFIAAYSKDVEMQFRVASNGQARSDVGFATPAEDFAELLPAVQGLQAGDVLIIGADGKLALSTKPYQTSVAGVYSTAPGFLGGQPVESEIEGAIPLAMVGVVPVKASVENGSIQPGDLLVTAALPGHAMRAGANPPQGTVLGKALEPLAAGQGMIRILVILQ